MFATYQHTFPISIQCDQIGRFIALCATFQSLFAQIAHILGNYCKGFKNFHFSSEIIFGQLLWTFGDFLLVTLFLFNSVFAN